MDKNALRELAVKHLNKLCVEIAERRVGSEGNRMASTYVEQILQEYGWQTQATPLKVLDWMSKGASLQCGGRELQVYSSPYALGCEVEGEWLAVDSLEKLEAAEMHGKVVVLHGAITASQIMPRNFVFYNPEEHQRIIAALDKNPPAALICATGRDSATAGGTYPFPLFEDGDLDIPSVYMKDTDGVQLLALAGNPLKLVSHAERIPSTAFNVIANRGSEAGKKIVVSAHLDAKIGTPGAIDNATGVTTLLLLAGMLSDYTGETRVELVAFNGEDYYAVPGQMQYIQQNEGRFNEIIVNINIDGLGYFEGLSCFSAFELPAHIREAFDETLRLNPGVVEGPPWYQGDHSIFLQFGCPAIAVSSVWLIQHMDSQDVTHTPKDNLDIVNVHRVVESAMAIRDMVERIC